MKDEEKMKGEKERRREKDEEEKMRGEKERRREKDEGEDERKRGGE